MSFSHEDVQRLLQLLDSSQFDELQLEAEGIKLSLRRNGAGRSSEASPASTPAALPRAALAAAPATPMPQSPAPATDPSLLEIRAPMLGTFYGAPKPGADPFVKAGERIDENTAVGIIEVMKLMNSIAAGVVGTVVEVLANDGDLVEYDQVLMRVRAA